MPDMLCHMAGMIKKEDIERVRNAADLYDIVSADRKSVV